MSCLTRRMQIAQSVLPKIWSPVVEEATAIAPINIALVKYWGKRDEELHLPMTDSLSVALDLFTTTTIRTSVSPFDEVVLNGKIISSSSLYLRCVEFLNLFRPSPTFHFSITTSNAVPTAAGLASSASGFAALTKALNIFFGFDLSHQRLSCLSRLGSGSACRSIYTGFVRWQKGDCHDGMDSYAIPFPHWWPELSCAVLMLSTQEKAISSSDAMRFSAITSPMYDLWISQVHHDIHDILTSIEDQNFSMFGQIVEHNALMMHATMLTSTPPICYWTESSITAMKRVWEARHQGLPLYFTMDAGPNIKLLFLRNATEVVMKHFPNAALVTLLPPSS